jgi:hypothetical protein
MERQLTLSYMAGFFDGEGCIGILKRKRKDWNIEYFVQISVGQKDGGIMDWVVENFKGHLHQIKRDNSYFWIISNKEAYLFLKEITPYLKYKKPQAEVALDFYENRDLRKPIPQTELARREELYLKMKELKHIFSIGKSVRRFND